MAIEKTQRETSNEIAVKLGGKLVHIHCYAIKYNDDIILLDCDLLKSHEKLLSMMVEKENESN
jgi:hypothetical protein